MPEIRESFYHLPVLRVAAWMSRWFWRLLAMALRLMLLPLGTIMAFLSLYCILNLQELAGGCYHFMFTSDSVCCRRYLTLHCGGFCSSISGWFDGSGYNF